MTVITLSSSHSSYPLAHSAADFATAAVASLAEHHQIDEAALKLMLFSSDTDDNNININKKHYTKKEENMMTSMDTTHPMINDWKEGDSDDKEMIETKSSLEVEHKSLNNDDNHQQNQIDDKMDVADHHHHNNSANNNNNNDTTSNNNSVSTVPHPIRSSSSSRFPLQIVLDMDETMSHYLPNTGTTITTLNLSDVPFYPAVGLNAPDTSSSSSASSSTSSWISSSSAINKGTNATFIYSSYPSLSNESGQVTILLEDGNLPLCEKRPLPNLGGVVLIRPHFRSFIERLSMDRHYDTTLRIWTAAPQSYADQILNSIGWSSSIKRIYQQSCAKFLLQRPLLAHRVPETEPINPSPAPSPSKPSSFEVSDLNVGDMIYLKPLSALFHLDGGNKWSAANTILIDNAAFVGLMYGQKQILAPDFIAESLSDYSLIAYWCQILQHRYPAECGVAMRSLGVDRLEDAISDGRLVIKRLVDDKWMEGKDGYDKIMKSIESLIHQPNDPADLDYFGKISYGEPIR